MKQNLRHIISTSSALVLTFSALAQEPPIPTSKQTEDFRERQPDSRLTPWLKGAAKASEILGMAVHINQDEKLGKVEDIAVDVESGRVVQVILTTGGLFGLGETWTAVPPGALHHDVADKVLHLNADKEKLKSAPKFENSKWAEHSNSEHLSAVYRHYGEENSYTFIQTNGSPKISNTRKPDGTWATSRISNENQYLIPMSQLGLVQRGSKVIGMPVMNLRDENLGKVEDLLLDISSGRIVAVILSTGSFIGIGGELSAVPPPALRFATDRETLQLDVTKEALSNSPHFKANQWPNFTEPSYASGIYRAYNVEPYFATNGTPVIDNTRRNVRDRDGRTLTPLDQGNK